MEKIRIKCPAKINLTLEVVNRREDGFHNIKSIMQTVNLYDYLDISINKNNSEKIILSGQNPEIPYDERNIVYKAVRLFNEETQKSGYEIKINIEKNIPVSAGLAGGSTDGAGVLYGLNILFDNILSKAKLHELCAKLGSDLNVCLEGGCLLATMRGEKIQKLKTSDYQLTLIKPKKLGISAKEAYTKYASKDVKPQNNMTEKMIDAINNGKDIKPFLYNDLEYAVFEDYKELQYIKTVQPNAVMSGSGSCYFVLENLSENNFSQEYEFINGLKFVPTGVEVD